MKVIGLTGGIAAGKSEAAKIIRQLNIPVFDTDAAVHEIYNNGLGAKHLRELFPDAIDGDRVVRNKLYELVTKQPGLFKQLELIIHPLVRNSENDFLFALRSTNHQVAVIDSPLLIETGHHKDMDATILIEALPEIQKSRAMMRPGMTDEKFRLIIAKQMPSTEKRKHSTYIVKNNGDLTDLENQIRHIFVELI